MAPVLSNGDTGFPIDGLSPRAQNVLLNLGVATIDDLARLSVDDLRTAKNCGRLTQRELLALRDRLFPYPYVFMSEDEAVAAVSGQDAMRLECVGGVTIYVTGVKSVKRCRVG